MRIAVVHSFYTGAQPSGENNVVLDQVAQLQDAGHDVSLIARHTDNLSVGRAYPLRAALTVVTGRGASPSETLRKLRPDVVHVHNTFPNWGTAWLREWAPRTVATVHNYRPVCAAGTLFRDGHECRDCLSRPTLPAVQHACYRGSRVATIPLALASSPRGSLRRIPNVVARTIVLNRAAQTLYETVLGRRVDLVPNFVPRATSMTATRGWVYVGRLGPEKGIDRLLRNWPQGESLDVIGDGELAEQVRKEVSTRPEINAFGLLPREQLLGTLASYRGVVIPSVCSEGLPTIVLEALARGVPAAMSSFVSASEQMSVEGTAVVYDPLAGASALRRALDEVVAQGKGMREAAQHLHAREYSPEIWQARIDSIYDDVASRRERRA
jgi:glycosyltransferase involved in cell wall biosynthesis